MHRFYAPGADKGSDILRLDDGETRHLRDVVRLVTGEEVSVFNGVGDEFLCVIRSVGKRQVELEVVKAILPASPESSLHLSIAAAITPPDKFDLVVQKCVELGVDRFTPLITERCDVRVKNDGAKLKRWRRIAFEAAKQCGRARLMEVTEIRAFGEFVASRTGEVILFSEREGESFDKVVGSGPITAIFGPKGGWDDKELASANAKGVKTITLGGRILRAETAAIALTAVLQHRFGDMN